MTALEIGNFWLFEPQEIKKHWNILEHLEPENHKNLLGSSNINEAQQY